MYRWLSSNKSISNGVIVICCLLILPTNPAKGQKLLSGIDPRLAAIELEQYDREEKVLVPMRDGIKLSANIFFPKGKRKNLPLILMRTPYNFEYNPGSAAAGGMWTVLTQHWLKHGYAVMFQYERGTFWSE